PNSGLAAFTIEGSAKAIWGALENDIEDSQVTEMTAKYGERLVEKPPVAYLRPVVLHHASHDSTSRNKEYMFPMVNVVECPQAKMLDAMEYSLVCTAITEDEDFRRDLMASTEIDRLNLGPIPTPKLDWLQPHEGNLIEFLYNNRALQIA
ncbi:MAG: aldehyde dehydrogenase, partial [Lacipirellulaceae bacterium]